MIWVFVEIVNVLKVLVMEVGSGLGAGGVINLIECYDNDNSKEKITRY